MIDFILVIVLVVILFVVYKQISCFDEIIETIEYPTMLIIYDETYQMVKNMKMKQSNVYQNKKYINLNKVINMSFYAVKMIIITY